MVQFHEQGASIKLAVVLYPQVLDGLVDDLSISSARKVGQLTGPVHALDIDLNCL